MKKQLKILLVSAAIIILLVVAVLIYYILSNKPRVINGMNFEYKFDNIENYAYILKDDFGNLKNSSGQFEEEVFLDDNVGMYDFSIIGDGENTTIKYTVKNHSNKTVNAFDYQLAFLNSNLEQIDKIDLNSQKIPKRSTYQVEIKIVGNVVGVYKIVPTYPDQTSGKIGGIDNETV